MTGAAARIAVRDTMTGQTEFHCDADTPEVVADKAARLRAAQPAWAATTLEHRIAVVQSWGEAAGRHAGAISEADSRDTGYGQISRIAPAMIQGSIREAAAAAPHQWRGAERAGRSPVMPSIQYRSLLRPFPLVGKEETFRPVAPVMAYDTPDEAVRLANDTHFGLSAAVMAGSEEEALAIATPPTRATSRSRTPSSP